MNNKNMIQNLLTFIPIFLVGLGTIMIYSSSSIFAAERFNDSIYFFKKQVVFAVLGMVCMFVMMNVRYGFYRKIAYPLWLLSIGLLIAVIVPGVGTKVGGAVRWLRLGPLSFQPSELAKLALVIVLSYSLSKKDYTKVKHFSIGVLPHLIFVVPVCLLIMLQPDFGTAMMLLAILFIILFAAGIPVLYLALMGMVTGVGGVVLVYTKGYRMERVLAFLDPWKNSMDTGFQIVQSFLAFGAGGLYGTGLGKGTQKLFYLPEPHTDFILSVIGEELGFLGVVLVIGLFAVLILCGIKIAIHASDLFGTYMALGIVILIGLQAATNMGVVMGLLPTKGTPLPFISYGGTSLVINLVAVGMLLSILQQCNFMARK